jgi:hypothetical protein
MNDTATVVLPDAATQRAGVVVLWHKPLRRNNNRRTPTKEIEPADHRETKQDTQELGSRIQNVRDAEHLCYGRVGRWDHR